MSHGSPELKTGFKDCKDRAVSIGPASIKDVIAFAACLLVIAGCSTEKRDAFPRKTLEFFQNFRAVGICIPGASR